MSQAIVKVSVIIPVYNTELYLKECLDSIINQTLKEIQIICINDGSTDNSLDILNHCALGDNRIHVFSQENRGQSAARNVGTRMATGTYIYFFDSDDVLELDALEYLYQVATSEKLDILYFDGNLFGDNVDLQHKKFGINAINNYKRIEELGGVYSGQDIMEEFHRIGGYRTSVCLQFFLKEFLEKNVLDFYEGILHEDDAFTFISMLLAQRTSHIKKQLFNRRVREGSIMTKAISTENVRGYIIVYIQLSLFIQQLGAVAYKYVIDLRLGLIRKTILKRIQDVLSNEGTLEKIVLTEKEQCMFQELVYTDIVRLEQLVAKKERNEMELSKLLESMDESVCLTKIFLNEKEKLLSEITTELKHTKNLLASKEKLIQIKLSELDRVQQELKISSKELVNSNSEFQYLKNSFSFRLGRAITFLPRKLRGGFKCCKDHGVIYTCKLFFYKITSTICAVYKKQNGDQL